MAVIDRIDTVYTPWTPSTAGIATEDEEYTGRHRRPAGHRRLSFSAMFYAPKHRRPGA